MDTTNEYIEYENKKKRKNKKLFIILSICIGSFVLICTVLSLILLLPVTGADVIENTFKSIILNDDIDQIEALANELNDKILKGSFEINLSTKMTNYRDNFNVKSDFHISNDNGNFSVSLIGKKATYTLDIFYSGDYIGVRGLYDDPNTCLTLPIENVEQALEKSVFHPNSGTFYAMSESDYEDLTDIIKNLKNNKEESKNTTNQLKKELTLLIKELNKTVKSKNVYVISSEFFSLDRTVKYSLDVDDVERILNVLKEHLENSEYLIKLMVDADGNAIEKKEVISKITSFKNSLHKSFTVDFSYTIHKNRIIKISYNSSQNKKSTSRKETVCFIGVVDYDKYGAKISIESENFNSEPKQSLTVTNEISVKTQNTQGEYSVSFSQDTTAKLVSRINFNSANGVSTASSSSTVKFDYDKTSNRYKLITYTGTDDTYPDAEYGGEFVIDKENEELRFTVDVLKEGGISKIKVPVINIAIAVSEEEPEVKEYNKISLLTMTEDEFSKFYRNINFDDLEAVWETYSPTEKLFERTIEGELIYDIKKLENYTKNAQIVYKDYQMQMSHKGETNVYLYCQTIDLYVILEHDMNKGNIVISYTYDINNGKYKDYLKLSF